MTPSRVTKVIHLIVVADSFVSLIFEIIQLIFHLGIFDVTDIILNGSGLAVGVWLFVLVRQSPKVGKYFHT